MRRSLLDSTPADRTISAAAYFPLTPWDGRSEQFGASSCFQTACRERFRRRGCRWRHGIPSMSLLQMMITGLPFGPVKRNPGLALPGVMGLSGDQGRPVEIAPNEVSSLHPGGPGLSVQSDSSYVADEKTYPATVSVNVTQPVRDDRFTVTI